VSAIDYSGVTEAVGTNVTREALDMLLTRYAFARSLSDGRDVLEVACGAGQGLGYLKRGARRVVGGDFTAALLRLARRQYQHRQPLVQLDAHALPFADRSFDVVLLYEAVYYLAAPERFVREARRLLRPGGQLVICSANPHRADFNPSPFSTRYLGVRDLHQLLAGHGFRPELLGAFPARNTSAARALVATVKRVAAALHLIPRSMKGKEWLKRMFLGPLAPFPAEVSDAVATAHSPVPIEPPVDSGAFKVLYAVGHAI
jgi:ubiquinone/menaquinone biosynthesis C-methylase UbiE